MKKRNLIILNLFLLLSSCGNTPSSSTDVSSSLPSSDIPSSEVSSETILPTASLTEAMLSSFKEGYAAESYAFTEYSDSSSGSSYFYEVKANSENLAQKKAQFDKETNIAGEFYKNNHYQSDDEGLYLYDAALSIGNKVIYEPITKTNSLTLDEEQVFWDEGYCDNFFSYLNVSQFTKLDENTFSLNMDDIDVRANEISTRLSKQLYGEIVDYTTVEHFNLLTNGDKIVGFDLKLAPYLSSDVYVSKYARGTFNASGSNVVKKVAPVENLSTDEVLENALTNLRNHNYEAKQKQTQFNYETESVVNLGSYAFKAYNGIQLDYDIYLANGKKYLNYGYYDIEIESEVYKQGVTRINGNYYNDYYIYTESVKDYLASFDIHSGLFVKDPSSTETKAIYHLNREDYRFSINNNSSWFTPFDIDNYKDRIVDLTITVEDDTVTFFNSTGALTIETVYSKINKVERFITEENLKTTCGDLTWEDLLSNNETIISDLANSYTLDVINAIPTFGEDYAFVQCDTSSTATPIFFTTVYSQEELQELLTSYGEKLLSAGYTSSTSAEHTYYTEVTIGRRTYRMNISLATFWNQYQEWGQFQAHLSLEKAA